MSARRPNEDTFEDVPLSALLRAAQRTYADAIGRAQAQRGFHDLPGTGAYLISAMNWSGASLEAVIAWMGVSKQAVSQEVDTLVVRGYLQRTPDRYDRRKVNLTLTPRGRKAGAAARTAVLGVDRELESRVRPSTVTRAREALTELIRMQGGTAPGSGAPRHLAELATDRPGSR